MSRTRVRRKTAAHVKAPSEDAAARQASTDAGVGNLRLQAALSPGPTAEPAGAAAVREQMGRRFGMSFSDVHLRTDEAAEHTTRQAGARAYARGREIGFARGAYAPETAAGRLTIAHEFAHVAQRRGGNAGHTLPALRNERMAEWQAGRAASIVVGSSARPMVSAYAGQQTLFDKPAPVAATADDAALDAEARAREDEILKLPKRTRMSITMSGIDFTPDPASQIWAGNIDRRTQTWAAQMRGLLGTGYSVALMRECRSWLEANGGIEWINIPQRPARENEPIEHFHMQAALANRLVNYLTRLRTPPVAVMLSAQQLKTLQTIADMEVVFQRMKERGLFWFKWYDVGIFKRVMFNNKALWEEMLAAGTDEDLLNAIELKYIEQLQPYELALSAVRRDPELTDEQGYRALWNMPAKAPGDTSKTPVVDGDSDPNHQLAAEFLLDSQAHYSVEEIKRAQPDAEFRRKLFKDWAVRMRLRKIDLDGDAALRDAPLKAVQAPDPSAMTSYPPLEPPYYDRQARTEMMFTMSVYTPNMWEHFIPWHYKWEVIRVPHDEWSKRDEVGKDEQMQGEDYGGFGSILGSRVRRNLGNAGADAKRTFSHIENILGPAGFARASLQAGGAALSVIGSVIRTAFGKFSERPWEYTAAIKEEGVYVVRCTATRPEDKGTLIHKMPSAAYLPIWVRSAQDISADRVKVESVMQQLSSERLSTVLGLLWADFVGTAKLDPAERVKLQEEAATLSGNLYGNAETLLTMERKKLNAIKGDSEAWKKLDRHDQEQLDQRLSDIDFILNKRSGWLKDMASDSTGTPEKLTTYFVTQEGASANRPLKLMLEVMPLKTQPGHFKYAVLDATARDGEHREGPTCDTRADAIEAAIRELLEDVGYGRGTVTVTIPAGSWDVSGQGEVRTIEILRSAKQLVFEGLENAALVASIAAIVAAPFTGGESLALLLPIGLVGAIPSAYRLVHRRLEGTFEWDMSTVMDIMNCVGAVAGLGQFASSLKLIQVSQRVWMIIGLGMDGLQGLVGTYDLIRQLSSIDPNMPEGARMAEAMMIVGNAMLQLGIAIGGRMAAEGLSRKQAIEAGVGPEANPHVTRASGELTKPLAEAGLKDVPVLVDQSRLNNEVKVHFTPDGYGMPSDIHIIAGKFATPELIAKHIETVQLLQKYSGLGGWIRSLWDRINALGSSTKYVKPGSRGFTARAEVTKIKSIIEHYSQEIAEGRVSKADGEAYLDYLKKELHRHEQAINEIEDGPGFIAAQAPVSANAKAHGYPDAPTGHYYLEEPPGVFQLRAYVGYEGQAKTVQPKKGGGWEIVDRPAETSVIAPGTPLPAAAAAKPALDTAQLRLDMSKILNVSPGTIEFVATPGDKVRLQPPVETGGKYKLHLPVGATTEAVAPVVQRHEKLMKARPADLSKIPVDTAGKPTWNGALEAEYRGRPTEEGYHWRLQDGKLQYVTEAVEEGAKPRPKRIWDETTGALKDDPLVRESKSFGNGPEVTRTSAFDELGGNDPKTPFGKWVEFMESLGFKRADLINGLQDPKGLTHDTVRHNLKKQAIFQDAIKRWLTDPAVLKARYPKEFDGIAPTDTAKQEAALARARHTAVLEIDEHLPLKDASNWTERWYIDVFGKTADTAGATVTKVEAQVVFDKDKLNAAGIPTEGTRVADVVVSTETPDLLHPDAATLEKNFLKDVKSHQGEITPDDRAQFADYKKMIGKDAPRTDGTTVRINGVTEVFLDPKGVKANAKWMATELMGDATGQLRFEVFNTKGQRKTFGAADAQRLGGRVLLEAAIIKFADT